MKLINSLTYANKTYTGEDIKGIFSLNNFGLDPNFYGGNAVGIAKTSKTGVYLVINESINPIDIMISEDEIEKANKKSEKKVEQKDAKQEPEIEPKKADKIESSTKTK